jgi:hypothetical protein
VAWYSGFARLPQWPRETRIASKEESSERSVPPTGRRDLETLEAFSPLGFSSLVISLLFFWQDYVKAEIYRQGDG